METDEPGSPSGPQGPTPPGRGRPGARAVVVSSVFLLVLLAVAVWRVGGVGGDGADDGAAGDSSSTTPGSGAVDGGGATVGGEGLGLSGEWRARDSSAAGEGLLGVGVSDELLVTSGAGGLIAYPLDTGAPVAISSAPYPEWDVDGSTVVWAEAELDEDDTVVEGSVWARRVPDGHPLLVASAGHTLRTPRVAGGLVAWTEPRPAPEAPSPPGSGGTPEWQYLTIRVAPLLFGDLDVGETRLVADDVTETLRGTTPWTLDVDPPYVAWQQDVAVDGRRAGIWVVDLDSGRARLDGVEGAMPAASSGRVVFESASGVMLMDEGSAEPRLVDPDGERPALSPRFVSYLRPRGADAGAAGDRQVVVRGLGVDGEWVLGRPPADLWFRPAPSVSGRFVAYLGGDGGVELFEWR